MNDDYFQQAETIDFARLPNGDLEDGDLDCVTLVTKVLEFVETMAGLQFHSLAQLKELKELFLNNSTISDHSVEGLSQLKQLAFLSVGGTDIRESGVTNLRTNLIRTRVLHWPKSRIPIDDRVRE